eukprot:m.20547 g.20547  ORF g.20547 m.20547 type:complete len:138 (-) comp5583_c0_seq1:2922-3335(-)
MLRTNAPLCPVYPFHVCFFQHKLFDVPDPCVVFLATPLSIITLFFHHHSRIFFRLTEHSPSFSGLRVQWNAAWISIVNRLLRPQIFCHSNENNHRLIVYTRNSVKDVEHAACIIAVNSKYEYEVKFDLHQLRCRPST